MSAAIPQNVALARPSFAGVALRSKASKKPMGIVVSRARARGNVVMMSATLPPKDVNVENTFLYDQLGGKGPAEETIRAVVTRFYEHLLAKPRMAEYFAGIDMNKQRVHQTAFITMAFGGPRMPYKGRDMDAAHVRTRAMGLNDDDFDTVVATLGATMKEFGMTDAQVAQAAAVTETTRDAVRQEGEGEFSAALITRALEESAVMTYDSCRRQPLRCCVE